MNNGDFFDMFAFFYAGRLLRTYLNVDEIVGFARTWEEESHIAMYVKHQSAIPLAR
jgi:hypothetical protein